MLCDILHASNAYFASLSAHQRSKQVILDKRCIRLIANRLFQAHTVPIVAAAKAWNALPPFLKLQPALSTLSVFSRSTFTINEFIMYIAEYFAAEVNSQFYVDLG